MFCLSLQIWNSTNSHKKLGPFSLGVKNCDIRKIVKLHCLATVHTKLVQLLGNFQCNFAIFLISRSFTPNENGPMALNSLWCNISIVCLWCKCIIRFMYCYLKSFQCGNCVPFFCYVQNPVCRWVKIEVNLYYCLSFRFLDNVLLINYQQYID